MRLRAALCVLVVLIAGAVAEPAAATTLHLTWRLVAHTDGTLYGAGRYVGYVNNRSPGDPFALIDDLTGRRTRIHAPGCYAGAMSTTWVAFGCGRRFRLYNIRTGRWRGLPCSATCARLGYWISITAVGGRWLLLGVQPHDPCGDGIHNTCGAEQYYAESIATGRMQPAPESSTSEIIDLNAPKLLRPVCPPLANPFPSPFPPALTFYGRFAVAEDIGGPYLERCGSGLRLPLATGTVFGNRQAVGVVSSDSVAGVFLPSLRGFTFALATTALRPPVLGPRHVYMIGRYDGLWRAVFPKPPTTQTRRQARPISPDRAARA